LSKRNFKFVHVLVSICYIFHAHSSEAHT
jgi:hypothetical protein